MQKLYSKGAGFEESSDCVRECMPVITELSAVIIGLAIAYVAAIYLFAKLFAKRELEAFADAEIKELFASLIIYALCITIVPIICLGWTGAFSALFQTNIDAFRYSEVYLNRLINGVGIPTIAGLRVAAYTSFAAQATIRTAAGVNPMGPAALINETLKTVIDLLFAPLILSLTVQLISLSFAQSFALTLILPAGVAARVFPFTKHGGSFLIALAAGLYFVWPLLWSINAAISQALWPDLMLVGPPITPRVGLPISEIVDLAFTFFERGGLLLLQGIVLPIINMSIFIVFVRTMTDWFMYRW